MNYDEQFNNNNNNKQQVENDWRNFRQTHGLEKFQPNFSQDLVKSTTVLHSKSIHVVVLPNLEIVMNEIQKRFGSPEEVKLLCEKKIVSRHKLGDTLNEYVDSLMTSQVAKMPRDDMFYCVCDTQRKYELKDYAKHRQCSSGKGARHYEFVQNIIEQISAYSRKHGIMVV